MSRGLACALALAACACLSDPRGTCSGDGDCAGGAPGLFCAEGICQAPPAAALEDLPALALARAATAAVRVRVSRSHGGAGAATARFEAGPLRGTGAREPDGRLRLDVPLSFAPAGAEGPAALAVFVADDLGHETRLGASLAVDDLAPRIAVDPASVPAGPVVRGAPLALHVTLADASPATLRYAVAAHTPVDAVAGPDGSYSVAVDTRFADPAATSITVQLTATDSVGNAVTHSLQLGITRLRWKQSLSTHSKIRSIQLIESSSIAISETGDVLFAPRDGTATNTHGLGFGLTGTAATDDTNIYAQRVDNQVCKMGADGTLLWCCGGLGTLRESPALGAMPHGTGTATTLIVVSAGAAATGGQRLHAVRDAAGGGCEVIHSLPIASFDQGAPAIASDGTIYAGATSALVAAQFDGLAWATSVTARTERFATQPALLAKAAEGQLALLATDLGLLEGFLFPPAAAGALPGTPTAPLSVQPSSGSALLTAASIGADGAIYVGTRDPFALALDPATGAVRWKTALPGLPTTAPTLGADGAVYFGTDDGTLSALSGTDGALLWSFAAGAAIRTAPAAGCDATLYFGTDAGDLFALALDAPGLADSPWPRAGHDVRGTGDARRPLRNAGACVE